MGACGLDSSGSRKTLVAGSCEHGNKPSGSLKCWEFLDWRSNCWLLKRGFVISQTFLIFMAEVLGRETQQTYFTLMAVFPVCTDVLNAVLIRSEKYALRIKTRYCIKKHISLMRHLFLIVESEMHTLLCKQG
jgi:hypothetical protein